MIGSSQEESTPVPEHVSVDNSNDYSSSAPSMSPVTLEPSSPSAKKHLFREEVTGEPTIRIQCGMATSEDDNASRKESELFVQRKMNEILMCLAGVPVTTSTSKRRNSRSATDKVVDLWHLRQLALTRGGLLNATIRKQVWLKLVDANEGVLMSSMTLAAIQGEKKSNEGLHNVLQLSDHEIKMIQTDIKRCMWNVEAEMKRSKMSRRLDGNASTGADTSLASFESASGQLSPGLPPERVSTFPSCDDNTHMSQETTFSGSVSTRNSGSATPRFSRRKREERSLLLNIITSVLRASPEEVKELDMERFFYFPGMHNVVAPILITLESPSLTALVLKRLSQYHLKDSMMSTFVDIQSTIRAMFMPLLEFVDKPLHDFLIENGVNDPCSFALRWVLCWFASDIQDYEIISRLFDVFLVSHYTHPVYVSVAILTLASNQSRIKFANQNSDMHLPDLLSSLPSRMVSSQSRREVVNSFESVIESSLTYVQQVSPSRLVHLAQSSTDEIVASSLRKLSKMSEVRYRPLWTYKSAAATDWDLIQEAKKARDLTPNSRAERYHDRQLKFQTLERRCFSVPKNELALDASGVEDMLQDARRSKRSRRAMHLFYLIALTTCISLLLHHHFEREKVSSSNVAKKFERSSRGLEEPCTRDDLEIGLVNKLTMVKNVKFDDVMNDVFNEFDHAARSLKGLSKDVVGDVKQYVKEDPDLFIIMI